MSFSTTPDYWATCAREIRSRVAKAFEPSVSAPAIATVSVFALAPIPLLALLGNALGPTIPVELYQRHVDTDAWRWKDGEESAVFRLTKTREGTGLGAIALLSVSGRIDPANFPDELSGMPVYELALDNGAPARCHIKTLGDLIRFREAYQQLVGVIRADNPGVTDLHLFAAVPVSVAVACGRDLLRKTHPAVHLYDFDRSSKRYTYALRVNDYDDKAS
jgi:hypothetical protein